MLKLWNFSATLGRPTSEEKERKRRLREAQLQQIQRELTLDRKLIVRQQPQRAKTFRHSHIIEDNSDHSTNNARPRSKSAHRTGEKADDGQFVSRLRFFDGSSSPQLPSKRHSSSAFLTPGDDLRPENNGLHGMRRRYTPAIVDSAEEETDFTTTTSTSTRGFRGANHNGQRLRFSDQLACSGDMSTTSGTNRSSHTSSFSDEDHFRSGQLNYSSLQQSNCKIFA